LSRAGNSTGIHLDGANLILENARVLASGSSRNIGVYKNSSRLKALDSEIRASLFGDGGVAIAVRDGFSGPGRLPTVFEKSMLVGGTYGFQSQDPATGSARFTDSLIAAREVAVSVIATPLYIYSSEIRGEVELLNDIFILGELVQEPICIGSYDLVDNTLLNTDCSR